MKRIALLILVLVSPPSYAKPVYLSCITKYQSDPPRAFTVTLDEETGKVTHRFSTGYAFNADGFFSADEVSYKKVDCSSTCMTQTFTINRVYLSVTSSMVFSARNVGESKPITTTGTCTLEAAPDRKF